jgi:hypothetical protein
MGTIPSSPSRFARQEFGLGLMRRFDCSAMDGITICSREVGRESRETGFGNACYG